MHGPIIILIKVAIGDVPHEDEDIGVVEEHAPEDLPGLRDRVVRVRGVGIDEPVHDRVRRKKFGAADRIEHFVVDQIEARVRVRVRALGLGLGLGFRIVSYTS